MCQLYPNDTVENRFCHDLIHNRSIPSTGKQMSPDDRTKKFHVEISKVIAEAQRLRATKRAHGGSPSSAELRGKAATRGAT